jgi:hypothetical protein
MLLVTFLELALSLPAYPVSLMKRQEAFPDGEMGIRSFLMLKKVYCTEKFPFTK